MLQPLHVIVPNVTPSYLLRVYIDWEEQCPIIAWRILYEELTVGKAKRDLVDSTCVFPISIEEQASNCIELIVSNGLYHWGDIATFEKLDEALAECRAHLTQSAK